MAVNLTVRERRFVNNFVATTDADDRWWRANLWNDIESYNYPHKLQVRDAVIKRVNQKRETGDWDRMPETEE